MTVLGPGTLKIGAIGSEIDISCNVNGARVTADKTEGDSTTKLCGSKVPGSVTYDAKLTGNIDIDSADGAASFFALTWVEPGTEQPFTFTPNTEEGTSAAGTLVIDPLDFGADKYGDTLTADFEFSVTGTVTYTFTAGGATMTREFRTGIPIRRPTIPPPAVPVAV